LEDWKRQVEETLREIPGYNPWDQAGDSWLDHDAALSAINWFADHLKHVEGSTRGDPFVLRKWQAAIVGNLFGWKRKDEAGRIVRRFRQCLIFVPRGNGKTPLAAGIVALGFFEDDESGAQCYLAAGQKEQAGILFRNLVGMVDQEPSLSEAVDIFRGAAQRSMTLKNDPLSFCKTIPADAAGQHGGIPHIIVVDELHVQQNRDLVDVFETGMSKKARRQPMFVMITTSDHERESICNEKYDEACRVRDNGGDPAMPGYDPAFLPVIYELKADADIADESLWLQANPNLDVSVSRENLRKIVLKATENPALESEVKRLHFNIRTKTAMQLISTSVWGACGTVKTVDGAEVVPPIKSPAELIGRDCFAGLDLSSSDDLTSASFAFPLPDDWLAVLSFSWCPEQRITRRSRQKFPYDVWAKQGYGVEAWPKLLTSTGSDSIDHRFIRRAFVDLGKVFNIREVGYDPHGASEMRFNLIEDGFDVVPIKQSFGALAAPTKELVRRTKTRRILHFNNPVLKWAIGNAAAHFDGKLPSGGKIEDHLDKVPIMLSKRKSTDKIDPAAALVLALARMGEHPEDGGGKSIYETRGVLSV
jgi:phage terminase large subunit-like protein